MAGQPFRVGLTTHWVLTKGFRYGSILLSQALPGAPKLSCKSSSFCDDLCDGSGTIMNIGYAQVSTLDQNLGRQL